MKGLFSLVLTVVLAGCGGPQPTLHLRDPEPPVSPPLDDAAAARMLADVAFLADDAREGRGTGTDGGLEAILHVASRFREIGLRPGGNSGYLQAFDATVGVETVAEETRARLGPRETPLVLGEGFEPADGSSSGEVAGRVVFVDYGIVAPALGRDDYEGKDVQGKVALVLRGAPLPGSDPHSPIRDFAGDRYKIRTARERGAIGIILVGEPSEPDLPSAGAGAVVDMGLPAIVLLGSVGTRIASSPRTIEGRRVELAVKVRPVLGRTHNVVGILPGGDPALGDEVVVVGAHHDHIGRGGGRSSRAPGTDEIHNGADDNASGTALLIEVARQMAGRAAPPARTVVFVAFGAEELGALGSRHFSENRPPELRQIVAMVNADMVGRLRENRLILEGAETSSAWADLIAHAAEGLELAIDTTADGFGASDQNTFYSAGIPVLNLFTGVHDEYHRPEDDTVLVDSDGMRRVATFATRFVLEVASMQEAPPFVTPAPDPHRGAARGGFRVSLGTVPDYGAQVRGVRLTGVRPDSPAARAGMRAGDVVVGLAAHEITNLYDYTFALRELEPGVTVPIVLLRDGERIELEITPAPGR